MNPSARTIVILILAGFCGRALAQARIDVADDAAFTQALRAAKPGTHIALAPGKYRSEVYAANLRGTADAPIVIEGADAKNKPVFEGRRSGMHLSACAHLTLRNIIIRGQSANGINIDDGGKLDTPAHHITLDGVEVYDIGAGGNHDPIKLSGLDDFVVRNCIVERWSGQGIDMVGCHKGLIEACTFRGKEGFNGAGVQTKGGSSDVVIRNCDFVNLNQRAVNIGGSTNLKVFRPQGAKHEARDITVEGCRFSNCLAPICYVGIDGAIVRYNTIYRPQRWIVRILQETTEPGFVESRNGRFENNLIVYRRADLREIVNIGGSTAPRTFVFSKNHWYCEDRPAASRPELPVKEEGGVYGVDPKVEVRDGVVVKANAPGVGADALEKSAK